MQVDCIHAEELVDTVFVTVGDLVIEVGVYSSGVYEFIYRALNPIGNCWTTLNEAVNEVAPQPDTYPMVITAEAILEGNPAVDVQIVFTINGVSKNAPYAESLNAGRYNFVFPAEITYEGKTYTLLGNNEFYIDHPANGETFFKASYFSYLPPPPIRVRFNATNTCLVDWGEGPQEYGSMLVESGTIVEVKAMPCEGYNFAFWRKNDVKVGTVNPKTFTITEDETKIDAIYTKEGEMPDWTKYLIWGVLGVGAVLLITRGGTKVVVVKGD